jgi:hypothetical protein
MRNRHFVYVAFFIATLGVFPTSAMAQCEGDALSLCSSAIPDRDRVKACLLQHFNSLSAGCRSQFREGQTANH